MAQYVVKMALSLFLTFYVFGHIMNWLCLWSGISAKKFGIFEVLST